MDVSSSLVRDPSGGATELVPQRRPLVDVEAAPCLALLDLVPKTPENLSLLEIRPTERDGRVQIRLACPCWMAELEVAGEAAELVAMPRYVLAALARRSPDAERLVVQALPSGEVVWRTFSADATVALSAPAADPLPLELPLLREPWPDPGPEGGPVHLNPAYLKRVVRAAEQIGEGRLELVTIPHNVVGVVLLVTSPDPEGPRGSIQLAAMTPRTPPAPVERPPNLRANALPHRLDLATADEDSSSPWR